MDKLMIGCILILVLMIIFILYCCVYIGSEADKRMEEIQNRRRKNDVDGRGYPPL